MAENGAKTEEKKIWKATTREIDEKINEKDFEETRRCLLNSYHSYVQTHAGYVIALIIGLAAIISTLDAFLKIAYGTYAFITLIIIISIASILMILRVIYWTTYANVTLDVPIGIALGYFNEFNRHDKKYYGKAPNTAIIQHAIEQIIKQYFKSFPWYVRWSVKFAQISFIRLFNRLLKRQGDIKSTSPKYQY